MINLGGFKFRLAQLFTLPLFLALFFDVKIRLPKYIQWLLLWSGIQALFIVRSPSIKNAIGYFLWLAFDILLVISLNSYINTKEKYFWLMRIYMCSFTMISTLGMLQFILFLFGCNFYVTQQWNEHMARINCFSYEPSYFATYILIGLVIFGYQIVSDYFVFFTKNQLKIHFSICFASIILSSSRMGLLFSFLLVFCLLIVLIKRNISNHKISKKAVIIIGCFALLLAIGVLIVIILARKMDLSFLLNGLGLFGMSSHSANERLQGLNVCLNIFKKSPILGYSLGGVDPMIAEYRNIEYNTLNNGEAMSIIGELLVANGIVGLPFFLIYCVKMIFGKKENVITKGMSWALLFELLILCFNQNILRPYLWMHIAVLSICVSNDKKTFEVWKKGGGY